MLILLFNTNSVIAIPRLIRSANLARSWQTPRIIRSRQLTFSLFKKKYASLDWRTIRSSRFILGIVYCYQCIYRYIIHSLPRRKSSTLLLQIPYRPKAWRAFAYRRTDILGYLFPLSLHNIKYSRKCSLQYFLSIQCSVHWPTNMSTGIKRKALSLDKKIEIISSIRSGNSQTKICWDTRYCTTVMMMEFYF